MASEKALRAHCDRVDMATARWVIWVRNTALAGVILAFVVFFGLPSGSGPVNTVAEVDGEIVSRDLYESFRQLYSISCCSA